MYTRVFEKRRTLHTHFTCFEIDTETVFTADDDSGIFYIRQLKQNEFHGYADSTTWLHVFDWAGGRIRTHRVDQKVDDLDLLQEYGVEDDPSWQFLDKTVDFVKQHLIQQQPARLPLLPELCQLTLAYLDEFSALAVRQDSSDYEWGGYKISSGSEISC